MPGEREGVAVLQEKLAATTASGPARFYGWRVVGAAFVLAMFGWGLGFYGPPVFLHAVREARGWPLALVSTAVTVHFLIGAITVANLPKLYRRFGMAAITKAGALSIGAGVFAWAVALEPWQLFAAAVFSGMGWAAMGAAAINAVVAPWFVRRRPAALSMAYNGASVGGIVFTPLWVMAIGIAGFPVAAAAIGIVTAVTIWIVADLMFSKSPEQMGMAPDGDTLREHAPVAPVNAPSVKLLPGGQLWRDRRFLTLSAAMALGLFAQIGLIAHLFSMLVPALGPQWAGLAMAAATAAAIAGRSLVGWMMPAGADRRLVAAVSYGVQIAGAVAFRCRGRDEHSAAADRHVAVRRRHRQRHVVAAAHRPGGIRPRRCGAGRFVDRGDCAGAYAFAPAAFGLVREITVAPLHDAAAPYVFVGAALLQLLAIGALLIGRRR